jgi:copper oxidase (laccase) domain-containing protein
MSNRQISKSANHPIPSQSRAQETAISIIMADTLAGIPWLLHGFSTRRGGVSEAYGGQALNLGITPEDTRAAVDRNRELFLQAVGACDDATHFGR